MTCLKAVSETQISSVLTHLTVTDADQLMQIIYFGLAQEQASISHVMLKWHEQVTSCFGAGCILRTLTCVQA